MDRLRVFAARLLGLFRKRRIDESLDAELRAHLQLLAKENMRRGMNAIQATEAARREFGGIEQAKEAYRDQRGLPALDMLLQDLKFALRGLMNAAWVCHCRDSHSGFGYRRDNSSL